MATTTESSSTDGPVLSVISKRIRALRKKLNRISQMEDALATGKPLNKEQEDLIRSKPVVTALIDELEKLRSPVSSALAEELELTSGHGQNTNQSDRSDDLIEDLLRLVYFASLFDVRSQTEFTAMMLTRSHERGCCLTYDYVTDDVVDLLSEKDLNLISVLGSLVTSRPVNEVISHKSALEECINHAKRWISSSDQPINPDIAATYAGLKEKLKKIISSDFFTATPEMKAPVEVAAAVGQLHLSEGSTLLSETAESDIANPDNKEEQENSQSSDSYSEHQSGAPDEPAKMDEVNDTVPRDLPPFQGEQHDLGEADMGDQVHADLGPKDQQANRRPYPNGRGGGRGGGSRRPYPNGRGGGGGGRGNGARGGGGGGGYANGGRGYYNDSNYQPRGYYNNRGGRGGGGGRSGGNNGGSMYARQGGSNGGQAQAAPS